MADNLLRECTRTEKTLSDTLSIGYKHLTEFIILWVMSFAILLFMKFSIKDFYALMLKTPIITPLIFVFFIICIVSLNLFINAFTDLTIKEEAKE
jgi:cytosine/uracil/thiamine/allantoin permease